MPPHDESAERFCLGYGMLLGIAPLQSLKPEHFFFDAHRHIFAALVDGSEGPHGVFYWLLEKSTRLPVSGGRGCDQLLRVGGGAVLYELVDAIPTNITRETLDLHASACADSVREHWRRRKLVDAMREVEAGLSGNLNSHEAWAKFREVCRAAVR